VGWFRLRWAHGSGSLFGPWGGSSRSYLNLVVVWEVVVNTDGEMWSHRDGFPAVGWSDLVWSGGVGVGRWGGSSCGGLIGRVVWTVWWFLPVVSHPAAVWEVVVNTDCEMWSHLDGFFPVWSSLVWSGGVGKGR
jgi:hypothetical protein